MLVLESLSSAGGERGVRFVVESEMAGRGREWGDFLKNIEDESAADCRSLIDDGCLSFADLYGRRRVVVQTSKSRWSILWDHTLLS